VRLVPWYLQFIETGRVKCNPNVTFTAKAAAVGHVDADDGFGHLASFRAIEEGIAMARVSGVAAITVGNSSHHGASGVYALAAARAGFAAISVTHADPAVVPFGGTRPFYGTNPISFAVPAPGEEPMLLDMATSSIPFNRVFLRQATGTPLPPEVAVTADGEMTTDPFAAKAVLPLGGASFSYKGAGLAAMVDILCSAFSGMGHGYTLRAPADGSYTRPIRVGHFFLVLMPAMFQAVAAFDARVGAFLADLRSQPAQPGHKVLAPGDVEKAEAARRATDGIPVDGKTWAALETAARRYGCQVPAARPTHRG
jgi:LDH2 family malate/lactate/ureidoglycolate dehydrogenase